MTWLVKRWTLLWGLTICGCSQQIVITPSTPSVSATPPTKIEQPRFEEITVKAGIRWIHNPCRSGHKYLPETVGGGGGFIDYNQDGRLDIVLINGAPLPGYKGSAPHHALYRNNGDGTFSEVTKQAGLDFPLYGMGATVGDYNNDGWPDLFLTAVGTTKLLRNDNGRFVDVTAKSRAGVKGFTTAAAWLDYDRDGRLDLFVGRYVEWSPSTDLPCGPSNARQYCAPHQYHGAEPVLLHQNKEGTFDDVSSRAGVLGHSGKTLAVNPYDFNGDGWTDLFIANDTEPDLLLVNDGNGRFVEQALQSGLALGTDGTPTGSMGTDVGTPFADGRTGLAIGVFAGQQLSLFIAQKDNDGLLLFDNAKQQTGVASPTSAMTTFGLVYSDVNRDGWQDIVIANGHIDDDPSLVANGSHVPYKQVPQLFLNQRDGGFKEVGQAVGLTTPLIGRGLSVGDYDNDGLPDLLIFENGGPVHLYHNVTKVDNHWLGLQLQGTRSVRDATGAMVTVKGENWSQTRCMTTVRSYLSTNDPRFLTGVPASAKSLSIRWPNGDSQELSLPALDQYTTIIEGDKK